MSCRKLAFLIFPALLLAGCGIDVPPAKSAYVGQWQADGMSLLITQDGRISYKRFKQGASTKIDAPLKAFHDDDFDVGIGPMATTFKVSSAPREIEGSWKMTVDGVELTRVLRH